MSAWTPSTYADARAALDPADFLPAHPDQAGRSRCPDCGGYEWDSALIDVRALSVPVIAAHGFICPACRDKHGREGRLTLAAWAADLGADQATIDRMAGRDAGPPVRDADLHAQIDLAAGAFRARFITDVPGQAQTYEAKAAEAAAWLTASDPDPADYPFLSAEAAASGLTVLAVAQTIAATTTEWRHLAAAIEGARMGAKRAVTAATTAETKRAAANVDWEALIA